MFEVEKDIPLPKTRQKLKKYPWDSMEIGDSFLVPKTEGKNARASAYASGFKSGRKYASRLQKDGTTRIWRLL